MRYYLLNIGKPYTDAWWNRHIQMGVITTGFENAEGDRGDRILRALSENDWVIAYANERGAIGAGIVAGDDTYRLLTDDQLPADFESSHRHFRSVHWIYAAASLSDSVPYSDLELAGPPRNTKTELNDDAARRIIARIAEKCVNRLNCIRDVTAFAPCDRVVTTMHRFVRDTEMARRVKSFYNNECQICGHTITLPTGDRYSEGHHIRPLGSPHNGPDRIGNVICVCPNHHVELDYAVLQLDISLLRMSPLHALEPQFIDYHNREICRAKTGPIR